ncbi:hypothetical protein GJ744_002283 [Endocarpon pusillum]|uniref:DUF7580 domain-containing protein n=1 Tax=Endocarpon pusillum TaxID=364733 RepID=A0A8H7ASA5_9EURO|nr:hypothetical protein GJ744_002283 [Endocarpon pusillum]
MIEQRIKKLVLLPQPANKLPEFNAPQCLGYFFDNSADDDDDDGDDDEADSGGGGRYGFVYDKPPKTPPEAAPVSLLELIQRSQRESAPPPSLTKRIALAHTLARSLMYFHSVNWLHKGLRSDNIIFFAPPLTRSQPQRSKFPPSNLPF